MGAVGAVDTRWIRFIPSPSPNVFLRPRIPILTLAHQDFPTLDHLPHLPVGALSGSSPGSSRRCVCVYVSCLPLG